MFYCTTLVLTHHADNRSGDDVANKGRIEWLGRQVLVVLLSNSLGGLVELKSLQLESLALEAADDLTYIGQEGNVVMPRR